MYIGKKRTIRKVTRAPLKGKKRKRVSYDDSGWRDYWGSNEELQNDVAELGPDKFRREILRLCETHSEASYYEAKFQLERDVLLDPKLWYNGWVQLKVRGNHLNHLRKQNSPGLS